MQDPELYQLMVTAAKAAPNLHILNQSFFILSAQGPAALLHHLCEEVITNALQ